MAQEARNEPTMEEILSSIRRIISEDELAEDGASDVEASAQDTDYDDELVFDDASEDPAAEHSPKGPTRELDAALAALRPTQESIEDDAESDFEALDEHYETEVANDTDDEIDEDHDFELETAQTETVKQAQFEPEPIPAVEPTPAPRFRTEGSTMLTAPISDDKTVEAAAGYLSKLLQEIEFGEKGGSQQTIDGLVRELLRPMMKEWLDDNLAPIVERQVEAEVARIARMAR